MSTDYIFTYIFITLIAIALVSGIYSRIKNARKPYHRYIKQVKAREKAAALSKNTEELKQISLERLYTSYIEGDYINSYISMNYFSLQGQGDLDARKHTILAEISAEELEMPNAHNIQKKPKTHNFFVQIVNKCQDAIQASEYHECYFMPESIIPFPKMYLLFALDYLLSTNLHQEDKHNYNVTKNILTSRLINVSPSLLPVDFKENKRIGSELLIAK